MKHDNLILAVTVYLSVEVLGTSCDNSRLVSRDHGSVGMSHQLGVEVERSSVASGVGEGSSSSKAKRSNCWASQQALSSEVLRPGSGHAGLVNRDDGTVGVSDQAVERGG